jgi:hypothetical protein
VTRRDVTRRDVTHCISVKISGVERIPVVLFLIMRVNNIFTWNTTKSFGIKPNIIRRVESCTNIAHVQTVRDLDVSILTVNRIVAQYK